MKKILRNILKIYLKFWARLLLLIHRPLIIVVAGSINKHFFKEAITAELKEAGLSVRSNPKNFNTEIGMPLAILDLNSGYNSYRDWLPEILAAPLQVFKKQPQVLVLSLGSARSGDMKYLMTVVKPTVSVMTDITQRYLEGYADMDNLAKEYKILAGNTKSSGLVVLNKDNYRVKEMAAAARAQTVYFSLKQKCEAWAEQIETTAQTRFIWQPQSRPYRIKFHGRHHIQAFLAAKLCKEYVATKF